jgi:aspartyl-tRNA(Asn)/glutamyl-tRNA(Gln) amidotransferase subunit A
MDAWNNALKVLESAGAEIIDISLPHTDYAIATYYILTTAEASSNLSRFEGIRYGKRVSGPDPFTLNSQTRDLGFGPEVKRRIILGTYVLSSGYYDAYYLKAQKVRTLIRQDFEKAFQSVDVILSPTSPTPAFRIGQKSMDPLEMYLSDIYTISSNLAGNCSMSIPCGFTENPQLPLGLQLIGPAFQETTILNVAHTFQQLTNWHKQFPVL